MERTRQGHRAQPADVAVKGLERQHRRNHIHMKCSAAMTATRSITAIIPARGGSRGLPRKNVLELAGRPLIAWTIEAALSARSVSRVLVTTDDDEIARISLEAGADVPFLRPPSLASDTSGTVDVALHAIDFLETEGHKIEWIALLQPTSPLRTADDIDAAVLLLGTPRVRAVVGVVGVTHPPQWSRRLTTGGVLIPWLDMDDPARRQDGDAIYRINGALYLLHADTLRAERTFLPEPTNALVMPEDRSIDIDTAWDFHLADLVLRDRLMREQTALPERDQR